MQKKSSHNLVQLLAILNDGEFHDGTLLGQSLNLTRSAIWKMIKKLERYGVQVKSVKGKGYALCEPVLLLDEKIIRKHVNEENLHLAVFETITSTNAYLKAARTVKGIHFCLAEQQTAGRGRLGRSWYSPFGQNIYLSCLYPFQKDLSELAGLSLVISLAVLRALQQFGLHDDVYVKWPNDITCQSKKISGILIDVQAESHGACQAIIGIGVNVNMQADDASNISQPWTSVRRVLGDYQDRSLICAALIDHLLDYLRRFDRDGFTAFVDEWMAAAGIQGKRMDVKTATETVMGQVAGVNSQGHLLLKMDDGLVRAFSSGDTSIIKH